ncbi:MAG: pilus assembly PilX N-terminal domain-containing protein [Candidatus Ancaeobacter aquaticus]|nr:pilus assembly PilX N-terminal domain-containing protein [Candidatus Ancaeobacter aquaticus]
MKSARLYRGSALVGGALFVLIMSFIVGNYMIFVSSGSMQVKNINDTVKVFYIAEAGLQRNIYELKNGGSSPVSDSLGDGSYQVTYSGTGTTTITSVGTFNNSSRTVSMNVNVRRIPNINGAATVYSDVGTTGNITIDGRDHDITGALTGDPGTYGLSTSGEFNQQGSSQLGGSGIAPASPAEEGSYDEDPLIIDEVDLNNDEIIDPWEILNVSEDWYTDNIQETLIEPTNFSGMYRYDPPGGTWTGINLGVSSGLLIVHNDTYTATMKNITGIFVGLIIADQVTHVTGSAMIIGAIVTLNQTGNFFGMGDAYIGYSSEALSNVGDLLEDGGADLDAWTTSVSVQTGSWSEL